MSKIPRIGPEETHRKMQDDDTSIELVCAYDDEQKWKDKLLEGAQTLDQFESSLDQIPRDRQIVFYCA